MKVSDLLNPSNGISIHLKECLPSKHTKSKHFRHTIGKPRSRFTADEDNIILEGVARKLTWGQISEMLPNRKRATCFNRYRTLQGVRKSRHVVASPTITANSETASPLSRCSMSPVSLTDSFCNESPNHILSSNIYPRKEMIDNSRSPSPEQHSYQLIHRPHLPILFSYSRFDY